MQVCIHVSDRQLRRRRRLAQQLWSPAWLPYALAMYVVHMHSSRSGGLALRELLLLLLCPLIIRPVLSHCCDCCNCGCRLLIHCRLLGTLHSTHRSTTH